MKRYGLMAALVVILLSNAFVFAGVFYNRSGEPDAELLLTERELSLARQEEENTALFLTLNWKITGFQAPGVYDSGPNWLNKEILKKIGFDTEISLQDKDAYKLARHQLPRPAWIVMEYDGPHWKNWETEAYKYLKETQEELNKESDENKKKQVQLKIDQIQNQLIARTRLVAIDAGSDPVALRQQYPNRKQYLILEGIVRMNVSHYRDSDSTNKRKTPHLNGYIKQIMISSIHVPNPYREFFKEHAPPRHYSSYYLPKGKTAEDLKPRYAVSIKYGKKYQPWITDIKPLK